MYRKNHDMLQLHEFDCGYVSLTPPYTQYLPSFLLGVVIPFNLLILEDFWYFDETSQVHTLAISHHHLLLQYTRITYVVRIVAYIL